MSLTDRIPSGAVHVCVDMQLLFAEGAPWGYPWFERVLPRLMPLVEVAPAQSIFTRFLPVRSPEDAPGRWRRYYTRWIDITGERLDPRLLELADPLRRHVPPAIVFDKHVYSPWTQGRLAPLLNGRGVTTLIVSGGETDVCVLATVLGAVDLGYRVILAEDALCSSSDAAHDALQLLFHNRFTEQIETAPVADIVDAWER